MKTSMILAFCKKKMIFYLGQYNNPKYNSRNFKLYQAITKKYSLLRTYYLPDGTNLFFCILSYSSKSILIFPMTNNTD